MSESGDRLNLAPAYCASTTKLGSVDANGVAGEEVGSSVKGSTRGEVIRFASLKVYNGALEEERWDRFGVRSCMSKVHWQRRIPVSHVVCVTT